MRIPSEAELIDMERRVVLLLNDFESFIGAEDDEWLMEDLERVAADLSELVAIVRAEVRVS